MARKAKALLEFIKYFQDCLSSVELCPQPVIAAVHGACVGGGEGSECVGGGEGSECVGGGEGSECWPCWGERNQLVEEFDGSAEWMGLQGSGSCMTAMCVSCGPYRILTCRYRYDIGL